MTTTTRLSGLLAAPISPMYEDGRINLDRIEDLKQLYIKNKVSGAFICGSTGEGSSLSFLEKNEICEKWASVQDGLSILMCVGGTNMDEMLALAKLAQKLELRGVAMLPPYYFKPRSLESLVDCCEMIAKGAPELEFYYYHIPGLSGVNFSMKSFLNLAGDRIPNLAGIKYSYGDLYDFQRCVNHASGTYTMLWGSDEVLLSAYAAGTAGGVGSTYNYAAPLYHRVIQAFEAGDMKTAKVWQDKAIEMVELLIAYGGTGATKAFMKIIGFDCGPCRMPLQMPSASQIKDLEASLRNIGFFEFCSEV